MGSVIQSHVGCMQHPPDRLMSHFPTPLQRQSSYFSDSVNTQRFYPKGDFIYDPNFVNESSEEGRHKGLLTTWP